MLTDADITIRRVRPEDATRVREARLTALATDPLAFGSTHAREVALPEQWWTQNAVTNASSDTIAMFLATWDDAIVGMVVTRRSEQHSETFAVYAVWVDPRARGRGVAARLLATVEAWAAERGGTALELLVADATPTARRVYERAGFALDGYTEPSPHPGVTEHRMRKQL